MTIENKDKPRTETGAMSHLNLSISAKQISCRSPKLGEESWQPF